MGNRNGGRPPEDVADLKAGEGFRELIRAMNRMSGPDAVGDWLGRIGAKRQSDKALRQVDDRTVRPLREERRRRGAH